ncbi:MAG: cell division ATPase MinD [Nanoarchaeota archaeon]|nr:cell division ATPase MinD [Nanoarchaeota archaeon]
MTKILSIVSGKGGTGKTTTAINLAMALASYGKNTVVVDGNLTTPNIGLYLGVVSVPHTLHSTLQGKNKLLDAMYEHPSGIKVIPGDIGFSKLDEVDLESLDDALLDLEGLVDYVLVDGAPGLGEDAMKAISVADGVLIVSNPEMPAVTDALKAIKLVNELRKPVTGVIVTRFRGDGLDMPVKDIERMLEFPVIGAVEEDSNVRKSMIMKNGVFITHPETKASKNFKRLAANLLDIPYREDKEKTNFLEQIKNLILNGFKK